MCNGKIVHIRCYVKSLGKVIERGFAKPAGLEKWCPNCDKERNTERSLIFDKHVITELFEENCRLIKEVMDVEVDDKDRWLANVPSAPDEMWDKIEDLLSFNASLRGRLAAKLIADEKKPCWRQVEITAPFMNSRAKRALKDRIRFMKTAKDVRDCLSKRYSIVRFCAKDGCLAVTLAESAPGLTAECSICFDTQVCRSTACKTCKEPKMCASCEMDAFNRFGRCPFCNV